MLGEKVRVENLFKKDMISRYKKHRDDEGNQTTQSRKGQIGSPLTISTPTTHARILSNLISSTD